MKIEKYHKVTREDYERWYEENQALREQVGREPHRLRYHLMPETGWVNDPNGLVEVDGTYHIYHQYDPFGADGAIKLWNHCTTRDFLHYEDLGPVLFPDHDFDAHGVYSGSAFSEDGVIHYFYTGNVKYFDRPDYDYITAGRGSNTVHMTSRDGQHFTEKELLMTTADYPDDISCHVRDPKILKHEGRYYMVLGARDLESRGLVLVYRSEDLKHWTYCSRISTREPFGYMWECPDLFFLDGELCLISCPQGVPREGIEYENVHQNTFMRIDGDFENGRFLVKETPVFQAVDRGFDFYAPQTFLDGRGRRILIGWMGIPEASYENPTAKDGWQHALTLPRQLHVKDGVLYQEPLEELKELRRERWRFADGEQLNVAGELLRRSLGPVFEAEFQFSGCTSMELQLRAGTRLSLENGVLSLSIQEGGFGRDTRHGAVKELRRLRIFSDVSSLEIFVNNGEMAFSTRVYADCGQEEHEGGYLAFSGNGSMEGTVYGLADLQVKRRR